jgi:hypothetical protein|tara:strand:- start:5321 stop:5671 length:351 start_codon:yes stop_codon:yes gene_type:complete
VEAFFRFRNTEYKMLHSPTLLYSSESTPLVVLAAAQIGGVSLTTFPDKGISGDVEPTLLLEDGTKIAGTSSLLRFIARASANACGLYAGDIMSSTMVISVPPESCVVLATEKIYLT